MRKIFAFIMALIMMMSLSTVAFTAEAEESGPVKHIVAIDVPAYGTADFGGTSDDDPGNNPPSRMWASGSYGLNYNQALYTLLFTIPDPYFAYETYATGSPTGTYTVDLVRNVTLVYASTNNYANGTSVKNDWISVEAGSSYQFKITNNSLDSITVYLTYYSWA